MFVPSKNHCYYTLVGGQAARRRRKNAFFSGSIFFVVDIRADIKLARDEAKISIAARDARENESESREVWMLWRLWRLWMLWMLRWTGYDDSLSPISLPLSLPRRKCLIDLIHRVTRRGGP